MVVTERTGKIVLVNAQTEWLFGYGREELLGKTIEMLMPKRYRRRHISHRADYFLHPAVRPMGQSLELYGMRKDGTEFPVEISLGPMETGEGPLVSSTIRDITRRREADFQLAHLAAIVKGSKNAIISATLDGIVGSWNPGAEGLFGYKAKEVVGRSLSLLVPPEPRAELSNILARVREGKSLEHYETTWLHKDGHRIIVSMTIFPVKNSGGAVAGVAAIARDITEQRRAEMALRESEERFRVALKNAPTVVFNHDRKLRYTWINSPVMAWAAQDWLGRTDLEILGREEGEHLAAIKRHVLQSGVGAHTETTVTFQGETHYFDLTVEPLLDHKGTCVGLTCAATDISQLKLSVLEQTRLVTELQQALEMLKQLSGLLSICASCKRITNERGVWEPLESYLQSHSEAKFTHGLCPDCLRKLYPEYYPK
jgi:PAS domain S-box-containing protein